MKTRLLIFNIAVIIAMNGAAMQKSYAQLSNLVDKAKAKAQSIYIPSKTTNTTATSGVRPVVASADFDFQPGDSVIVSDNFSTETTGSFPLAWKTNGSGKVITIPDIGGKWLELGNGSTFKLKRLVNLPAKFTIEFDVVAIADQITDLDPLIFGFAVNNSIASYIQDAYNNGAICIVSLLYFNKTDDITVSSSKTKVYANSHYDLESYTNRVMHISIAANENQVAVYLDKNKIADTQLFKNDLAKYLFISAPLGSKNNAKVAISNVSIKTFKH